MAILENLEQELMEDNEMVKFDNLEQELQEARSEYCGELYDDSAETDIIAAAHVGNLTLVEHLIEKGADVNVRGSDYYGRTALIEAVIWGHKTIIEILLKNGAQVNDRENVDFDQFIWGCSAILHADDEEAIDILLKYGANIDDIGPIEGNGLLHKAVEQSNLDRINFLLSRNASIDLEMQNGMTPLMIAVKIGNFEIIKLLVGNGADVNHRDKIGLSVLQLAKVLEKKEIEKFLVENGAFDNNPRLESLTIYQPDGYGVENYFMIATKRIITDDGTIHIFSYGTGFTSRWYDLAACRRLYFCVKDSKLLYHLAGCEHRWYHFVEYDDEGNSKEIRLDKGSEDLSVNFTDIQKKLKDCKLPPKTIVKFKPNKIDGIDMDEEFASLKKFFNEYIEINEIEVIIPESNFTFYYPMFQFTDKGADFCGEATYSETSNFSEELLKIIGSVYGIYFRI
jgi:ankyrin repeat protein